MTPSPKLISLLIVTNVFTLLALGCLLLTGFTQSQTTSFKEIKAERINIVDPAGKTVIAISNKERIAPPVMGGKTYPVEVSEGRARARLMIDASDEAKLEFLDEAGKVKARFPN